MHRPRRDVILIRSERDDERGEKSTLWADAEGPDEYLKLPVIESEAAGYQGPLRGRWAAGGSGATVHNLLASTSYERVYEVRTSSEMFVYSFDANGTYSLLNLQTNDGGCRVGQTSAVIVERGKYSFDGSALSLSPAGYEGRIGLCGAQAERASGDPGARTLRVASAVYREASATSDGGKFNPGVILRGPCPSYTTSSRGECEQRLQRMDALPTGIATPRWLGQSCSASAPCMDPFSCDTTAPGGVCTRTCAAGRDCSGGTCVQGVCLEMCILSQGGSDCRKGYTCADASVGNGLGVCAPR